MIKKTGILLTLLLVCACCKAEPGDKTDMKSYWNECWAVWKNGRN